MSRMSRDLLAFLDRFSLDAMETAGGPAKAALKSSPKAAAARA